MAISQQQQQQKHLIKNQKHYIQLLQSLKYFFNVRVSILILVTLVSIVVLNELYLIKSRKIMITPQSGRFTSFRLNHILSEFEQFAVYQGQMISKLVQKQYKHFVKYNELYYPPSQAQTLVQKLSFQRKYSINSQYKCLNSPSSCSNIQMYLNKICYKTIFFKIIEVAYIKYYDPINNTTNIAYAPSIKNNLQQENIRHLLAVQNSTLFQQKKVEVIKVGEDAYFRFLLKFNISSNSSFTVVSAIKVNKQQFINSLKKDLSFISYSQYRVRDNLDWINFQQKQQIPILSYSTGTDIIQFDYFSRINNETLIKFTLQQPFMYVYTKFFKITLLLPVLILLSQFFRNAKIYRQSFNEFFKNIQRLISLYQFNINEIFTGNVPKASTVLNSTTSSQFYQQLSQIPTEQFQPIKPRTYQKKLVQSFKFNNVIKKIVQKYNQHARLVFKEKNKEIINNKFFIHSSVNQISQAESVKVKQAFARTKQLGMVQHFFKFSYLALLLDPKRFDKTIQQDKSPLPQDCMKLIRQINRTVFSTDVRKAFKLSSHVRKQTQDELQMRIQISLLQKYIQIFKDLDIHNEYAKQLGLQQQIQNLNEYIQNIKHVLNKHNKNIRTLGK